MNNLENRFRHLLTLYLNDDISIVELEEFFELVSTGLYDQILSEYYDKSYSLLDSETIEDMPEDVSDNIIKHILGHGGRAADTFPPDNY